MNTTTYVQGNTKYGLKHFLKLILFAYILFCSYVALCASIYLLTFTYSDEMGILINSMKHSLYDLLTNLQVKRGVCEWLAWLLRMKKPGQDISRNRLLTNHRMRDLELRERSSRSLLANVLDLEDDFRISATHQQQQPLANSTSHNHCSSSLLVSSPSLNNSTLPRQQNHPHRYNSYHPPQHHPNGSGNTPYHQGQMGNHVNNSYNNKHEDNDASTGTNEMGSIPLFKDMLKEIRFLTDKLRRD